MTTTRPMSIYEACCVVYKTETLTPEYLDAICVCANSGWLDSMPGHYGRLFHDLYLCGQVSRTPSGWVPVYDGPVEFAL